MLLGVAPVPGTDLCLDPVLTLITAFPNYSEPQFPQPL